MRHAKGTYSKLYKSGLPHVKDVRDVFVFSKGTSVTFLQGSIDIGDTGTKAPNDRRNGARAYTQLEVRSWRPCTDGRTKVAVWKLTRGDALLER
jgi:hypothetical protein